MARVQHMQAVWAVRFGRRKEPFVTKGSCVNYRIVK
jgi:hypothetical protein